MSLTTDDIFTSLPRYAASYAALALFFLFDLQIAPFFFDLTLKCLFVLPAIYFWAIFRPSLIPPWFLFLISLLKDLISGWPLGLSGLIFLGVYTLATRQKLYLSGQSFMMLWAGFCVLSAGFTILIYLLLCLFRVDFLPVEIFMIEGGLMMLCFPVLVPVLSGLNRLLPLASSTSASLK